MEFVEEEILEPVSPSGQYLNSSVISLTILGVLEIEVPIRALDLEIISLVKDVFLPINHRFSSVMVAGKDGIKKWKKVEVEIKDHIKYPTFPEGKSLEFYDEYFSDYLSKMGMDQLPQSKPLWEIHIIKYPTSNAAGTVIFKFHHSLGDGYSLMGALLSCLQRVDNPSLPLTFPTRHSSLKQKYEDKSIFKSAALAIHRIFNTAFDFGESFLKSTLGKDDRTPIWSGDEGVEFRPVAITTITFSLDHIKQIKNKLNVTINDVITGIVLLGSRLYMEGVSHESRNSKSTILIVFNTRGIGGYKSVIEMIKPGAEMPWGNNFTFFLVPIPGLSTDGSSNPLNFISKVHNVIERQKNSAAFHLTGRLYEHLRRFRGPEAVAKLFHGSLKNSSIVLSNLIGPLEKMALADHPVKGLYFTVTGVPLSLEITMISYMGKLQIAIQCEKGFIDPREIKSCIQNAFDMTFKAAIQSV